MALVTLRHHVTGDLMEVHDHHAEAYLGAGWVREQHTAPTNDVTLTSTPADPPADEDDESN